MKLQNKKQQGFSIFAVILVIVAVIVAIGIWALSGQTNTSNSTNNTADIQASSIVNDASTIKLAFDQLVLKGGTVSTITFAPNTASNLNILDPTNGIQAPKPNANAIRTGATEPEGIWVLQTNVRQPISVGTAGNNNSAIVLAGIKDSVCQRINYNLYGSTAIPAKPTTSSSLFVTGATAVAPTSSTLVNLFAGTGSVELTGWTSGCVSANNVADNNMYFRFLQIR